MFCFFCVPSFQNFTRTTTGWNTLQSFSVLSQASTPDRYTKMAAAGADEASARTATIAAGFKL